MASTANDKIRFPLIEIADSAKAYNFSTDIPESAHVDMSLIHNVFIRGLNSIYYYAPRIKQGDEVSFAGYALVFTESLHLHHHGEEEILFPFLQEKNDMKHNIEQHDTFKKPLETFGAYMQEVFEGKAEYSGDKVRQQIEAFGDILVEHLHDEISTISPERMAAYDKDGISKLAEKQVEHIRTFPLFRAHPFVMTHHDTKGFPAWPPIPPPVKWLTVNVIWWRHKSYWKFSPFTRYGESQEYTDV
ncbi:hypothetical protein CPB83DRAFT_763080 [Crepidotus variabilis]|uniref:Hemerythrin-like domain-containing protein n=1 Tax=Crepidotus variabilis TaxID=179855 RepID=A0A9P6EKK4_9AGAR|nr:hypothetical protein CPB83DRAFT_763080 [Crepidotus variabilis]